VPHAAIAVDNKGQRKFHFDLSCHGSDTIANSNTSNMHPQAWRKP